MRPLASKRAGFSVAKPIRIDIITAADLKGVQAATKALGELSKAAATAAKAQTQVSAAAAKYAQDQAKIAIATARTATEQGKAATQAQRLSTEYARTTRETANATRAQQSIATEVAKTARAQDQAALSATRLSRAQSQAANTGTSSFAQLARAAGGLEKALGAAGVAFGAAEVLNFSGSAVKMTASLDTAKRSLDALAGSPKLYAEALANARQQQLLFGGSLEENISGIQGLITVSRSSGIELNKLIDITQRLAVRDPSQGAAGARIALQEGLSGDPVSLARRYEIPKAALKALRDEGTTTAEKLQVIDDYLNGIGITSETAAGAVSPLAVSLNTLGASAERAQVGIGTLLGVGLEKITPSLTALFDVVGVGLTVITSMGERMTGLSGQLLTASSSFDEFNSKQQAAAGELLKVGQVLPMLTEEAYTYAQALIASGTSADQAAQQALALAPALAQIGATQRVLTEDTGITGQALTDIGLTMTDVAAAGGPLEASLLALITSYRQGRITADEFLTGLAQLASATEHQAQIAGIAAEGTVVLASALDQAGKSGAGASGGLYAAAGGADAIAGSAAAAIPQVAGLLDVMQRLAGGAAQQSAAKGFTAGITARAASAASRQSVQGRLSNQAWAGASASALADRAKAARGGGGGGGAARISEAEKTAEKLLEIEERTADQLMAIDARVAAARVAAQKKLAATLLTSANAFAVESQSNDLDFFGKDVSDEEKQKLADREKAEATARESQKQAIEEAKQIAADGDAELAEATYDARQDQIRAQQQLDETYLAKQREVGKEQQADLTTQYDEAKAAIEAQTADRIALAQAEAQARIQAVADEKAAAIASGQEASAALLATGGAASTAKGQVNDLAGALAALPKNVTTTVTVRTVNEGGSTARPAPASNKAAGGADFLTTGPMDLRVGDNPGGIERVTVEPISGTGTTRITGGGIALAGGGVVDSAAGTARSRLDAGTTPTVPVSGAAKAAGGGGKAGASSSTTDPLEQEAKALQLMLEVLDLRKAVADAQVETAQLDIHGAYAYQLRRLGDEAQLVARIVTNRIIPLTKEESEGLDRYLSAAGGAIDVLGSLLDLKKTLAETEGVTADALDIHSAYAYQLRRLGDEANLVARIVANRLVPITETQAEQLDRYVNAASASLGLLAEVADLRATLEEPTPALDLAYAAALADDAQRVTQIVRERLLPTTEAQATDMSRYADAAGASIGILRDVAGLRQDAEGAMGLVLQEADIARLADDAQRVTQIVSTRLVPTSEEQADGVGRYANAVGSSVSVLRDTLDLQQSAFAGYVAPTDAQIGQLARDADRVVRAVAAAATTYDTKGLEAAQKFGDAYGSVVSAFSDGLKFNEGLLFGAAVAPDVAKLKEFAAGASAILDVTRGLAVQAQSIPQSGLAALQTATSAITAQADAMIRLAAVPFADLPAISGAFGGTNAGSVGGGTTVNIYNPPQGMDVNAVVTQVKNALTQQTGMRR